MVGITSRRLIHNLNEIKRLETHHFTRLGQGEAKTVKVCGGELNALALHYMKFVGSRRVGIDTRTCQEVEEHFRNIAEAMEHLHACLLDQPVGIQHIYNTYEHGHAAWSLDGHQRSTEANNVIMQLWHDGHAAEWFMPALAAAQVEGEDPGTNLVPQNRQDELVHLAGLMRRLSGIYQGLQGIEKRDPKLTFDEKDALVFNLAELIRQKARPALHSVDIATSIHVWATGDLNPEPTRFVGAYRAWKNRPVPDGGRLF